MAKYTNPEILDAALNIVASSDELAVCTSRPASFFNAVNPYAWIASTAYVLDATTRPMVDRNGFTYVCTSAGTSGANEPVWPTTAGQTVSDGSVVWRAESCVCVANAALTASDFIKSDGSTSGSRKITTLPKTGMTAHSTGNADHVAFLDKAQKKLVLVTTMAAQVVTSGNLVNTASFAEEFGGPV